MTKTRALKARLSGEYTALNNEVKKSARRDRRDHVERMTQDAEDAAGRGDTGGALPDYQEAGWEEEHSATICPKQGW